MSQKRIAIFGSTGSIGKQTLEVIAANPDLFVAEILTAHANESLLIEQALQFEPNIVVIGEIGKYAIVKKALEAPLRRIALNAGMSPDVVVNDVLKSKEGKGLDARLGKIVNMLESGIIDPAKVTRCALQNAASIAGLVLTTETLIVEKPVESDKVLVSGDMLQ